MEKYARFTKITNDILKGRLSGLSFNYENKNQLHVIVSYELNDYFWLDYELDVDLEHKHIDYASHHSKGSINKVELNREKEFEEAVSEFFFAS
jgi:hypothetical protein